ncbi:MAG: archease [Ignavibacteria bacterium]|nr:archease [Ignavibacteria bacterium]
MSIEFLEHTSDIGVRVIASKLENAFEESAAALLELIFGNVNDLNDNLQGDVSEIKISGIDSPSLLVNFLNEILYLIDSENIYPNDIKVKFLNSERLNFKYCKKYFELENHPINLYVKAVTYHQLKIINAEENAIIEYFVDI